ncbi:MAG TPA: 2'-5' RNA ligase family protein [Jatrophihabitans sp.]|jgi:2'-5' RNA ligase
MRPLLLGVAIAIPAPHAAVLTSWRHRVGDPAADLVFPHVTLLPPTAVEPGDLPDIEKHLEDVAQHARPFVMHLAGTGTFRPTTPVVFVQVARGVGDCEELESAIRRGPLERELDFPYHPHVTIAHDIDDPSLDAAYDGLAGFIARFEVSSFVLFSRNGDQRWRWRREFPLGNESE